MKILINTLIPVVLGFAIAMLYISKEWRLWRAVIITVLVAGAYGSLLVIFN